MKEKQLLAILRADCLDLDLRPAGYRWNAIQVDPEAAVAQMRQLKMMDCLPISARLLANGRIEIRYYIEDKNLFGLND